MRHLLIIAAFALLSAAIFYIFPNIDIHTSFLFYTSKGDAQGFIAHHSDSFMYALYYLRLFIICCTLLFIAFKFLSIYRKTRSFNILNYKIPFYIIFVCVIGVGVLVEGVVKNTFNRPRPCTIQEFGGDRIFSPSFVISDQCSHNCSFVSGHASASFMLFSIAFTLQTRRNRMLMNLFAIGMGLLSGYGRIVLGKHFLSDVIFAGFFLYIMAYISAILFKLDSVIDFDADKKNQSDTGKS